MEETDKALELGYDSLDEYKGLVDDTTDSISKAKKEQAEFSAMVRGVPVPTGVAGPKITLTKKGREKEKKRRQREEQREAREAERAASRRRARMLKVDLLNAEVRKRAQLGILDERRKIEIAYEKDIAKETDEIRKQNIALEKEQALANYDAQLKAKEDAKKQHDETMALLDKMAKEEEKKKAKANSDFLKKIDEDDLKAKEEKARREARIEEMSKSATLTLARGAIDALIQMDEDLFIASIGSAMSTAGTEIFMDGLTTLWKGTAQNALFPGLGATATAVGLAEMAAGTSLMAGGAAISNAVAPSSGGGSSAGAQERNTEAEQQDTTIFVQSTLYPDKTTFQKEFKRNGVQIKT